MKRYQYYIKKINLNTTEGEDLLQEAGQMGWELKAIDTESNHWVFMRQFPSQQKDSAVKPKEDG